MDRIGEGSLKLVVIDGDPATAREIAASLRREYGHDAVRRLGDSAYIVHCKAEPAVVRDSLVPMCTDRDTVLVGEFERWSSCGDGIDRRWMLRRGH